MDTIPYGDLIGLVASVIQIGVFVFTIVVLWRTRRRLLHLIDRAAEGPSERPTALVVGIGNDIRGTVERFLAAQQLTMPVRDYARTGRISDEKFYIVLRDLLKIKQELSQQGVTEVHLFYMGPVTLAMGIGAILDNWVPVHTYNFYLGQYHKSIVLDKGAVLGLLDETVSEGEEAVAGALTG